MKLINSLLTLFTTSLIGIPVVVKADQNLQASRCSSTVARMLSSGDQLHKEGRLLCAQDRLQPAPNQQPIVVCHNHPKILRGGKDNIANHCSPDPKEEQTRERFKYVKGRGSIRTKGKPSLIQPFGVMVLQSRPRLAWNPVPKATSYYVVLETFNGKWDQIVNSGNSLSYPQAWPDMKPGNQHKFTVFAYKGNRIINSDTSKLILLSKKESELVEEAAALARQLPLSPVEEATELDAIYMSQWLLNKSIGVLKSIRESGQSNARLNRLLADRYTQAGQPELADPILKELQLLTKRKFPQK